MHFRLMAAFGQFLVGMALHDRTVKLLELGGKKDEEIVSEMPLGQRGQINFQIDAYEKVTSFAVSFELEQRAFSWQRFDQQRQLHHCKNNVLEQVCGELLIRLKLKTNKIAVCDLALVEELDNLRFEVTLPPQPAQIASFYPVLSPDETRLLIALSYGRDNQTVWTDDKHTGLILVDIHRRRS